MAQIATDQATAAGTLSPQELYRQVLRIRLFEELCQRLSDEGVIAGSIHLCAGQEIVPVAAGALRRPDDKVVATYRGHGWALVCGVPMRDLLAEVAHREPGLNGGRGGSPYLTAPKYGFIGENSIVGAGVPIAAGVALAQSLAASRNVAIVSIGDGATSEGATHEALVFAAARSLPLVVVCENNGWSEMTPISAVARVDKLATRAAGYGIASTTVDGLDYPTVADALSTAFRRARSGEGPTFVECQTLRLWGHYNADIEHYRPGQDKQAAAEADPLPPLRAALAAQLDEAELAALEDEVRAEVADAESFALEAPRPSPSSARDHVVGESYSGTPPVEPAADAAERTYVLAVNLALQAELSERDELVVFGEDVGVAGGVFGATRNLQKEFGEARVFDTPIAESAILGAAVGLSTSGFRPVVEVMWTDFLLVALDQLINQAANVRYLSRGAVSAPLVVRTQQGVTPGSCAQHSQSLEALLAHIPGLKVGLPATPQDAYSMLRAAVADDDPCILIESRRLYRDKGAFVEQADRSVGGARRYRSGKDLAIFTWGTALAPVLAAAQELAEHGVDSTVVDLRWLSPLDEATLSDVLVATGRGLIVHEANVTGGFGAEVVARLTERHFSDLKAPLRRLGTPDVRIPAAPNLQEALIPTSASVLTAALDLVRAG